MSTGPQTLLVLFDPMDDWEVNIFNNTSSSTEHPSTTAMVAEGYALTGGGAEAHWIKKGCPVN
jgi:hypothetical protein